MNMDNVKDAVDRMIMRLLQPLADADVRAGWNPLLQQSWVEVFERIKSELEAGTLPRRHEVNMTYGLATFGVDEGPLASEIVDVGNVLQMIAVK